VPSHLNTRFLDLLLQSSGQQMEHCLAQPRRSVTWLLNPR